MTSFGVSIAFLALFAAGAQAQPAGCDQGVVRLPDSTGTVVICPAYASKVPLLAQQMTEALKALGTQQAQIKELTHLVKGLNTAAANIGADRQAQLLANLSSELARAQRAGGDRPARTLDDLGQQLDDLRDQLVTSLGNEKTAASTQAALHGPVGDAIARLEIRSAGRQLDEIDQRLQSLQADMGTVKSGVASANAKLDRIGDAVDPARAADRCAELDCALAGGASAAAVQRLLDKGARLSGNRLEDGELAKMLVMVPNPDRFRILDLLAQRGLDRGMLLNAYITDRTALTAAGFDVAQQFERTAPDNRMPMQDIGRLLGTGESVANWNDMAGCLYRTSGGVSLMELAVLLGDRDMVGYLQQHQQGLPARPLACKWLLHGRAAGPVITRLEIEVASGRVQVARQP